MNHNIVGYDPRTSKCCGFGLNGLTGFRFESHDIPKKISDKYVIIILKNLIRKGRKGRNKTRDCRPTNLVRTSGISARCYLLKYLNVSSHDVVKYVGRWE